MRQSGNLPATCGTRWRFVAALLLCLAVTEHISGAPPESMPAMRLFEKASPSVVSVVVTGAGRLVKRGTGFLVSDDGLVATNYHVIKGGRSAEVILPTRARLVVKGVVASNRDWDLAILRVEGKSLPFLKIAKDDPKIGAKVYAIGNPKGLTNTLSEGLVSGVRELKGELSLLQTTAAISAGSSGGPLLADNGEVVGITTATLVTGQNLNFAVPGKLLLSLLSGVGEPTPLSRTPSVTTRKASDDRDVIYSSFGDIISKMPKDIHPGVGGTAPANKLNDALRKKWIADEVVGARITLPGAIWKLAKISDRDIRLRACYREICRDGLTYYVYIDFTLVDYQQDEKLALAKELSSKKQGERITVAGGIRALSATIRPYNSHEQADFGVKSSTAHIKLSPAQKGDRRYGYVPPRGPSFTDKKGVHVVLSLDEWTVSPNIKTKPASRPAPHVLSPEEKARGRFSLAKAYLTAGRKQKALDVLRSVIRDFPETGAAVQAQREIGRLVPGPSKKE